MIGVDLLRDIDEALASTRIDASRDRIERKPVSIATVGTEATTAPESELRTTTSMEKWSIRPSISGRGIVCTSCSGPSFLALAASASAEAVANTPANKITWLRAQSDRIIVLDLRTEKVLGTFTVANDPDVLALEPGRQDLYVAGESGQVTAFS
jgi:DNA-binding beta-propeller fold protein YncE